MVSFEVQATTLANLRRLPHHSSHFLTYSVSQFTHSSPCISIETPQSWRPPNLPTQNPRQKQPTSPPQATCLKRKSSISSAYILETNKLSRPPLTARISRFSDSVYNFVGLYFVSLFSLDPYTAAQNSSFNTRGRGNAYQERARWGGVNRIGGGGGSGGSGGSDSRGGGGGGAGFGGGGSGRRMGTVDDVRGPECGSCG